MFLETVVSVFGTERNRIKVSKGKPDFIPPHVKKCHLKKKWMPHRMVHTSIVPDESHKPIFQHVKMLFLLLYYAPNLAEALFNANSPPYFIYNNFFLVDTIRTNQ